jgi:hypothetical protein
MGETREDATAWVDQHLSRIFVRVEGRCMAVRDLPWADRRKWRAEFIERRRRGAPIYELADHPENA